MTTKTQRTLKRKLRVRLYGNAVLHPIEGLSDSEHVFVCNCELARLAGTTEQEACDLEQWAQSLYDNRRLSRSTPLALMVKHGEIIAWRSAPDQEFEIEQVKIEDEDDRQLLEIESVS